MGAVISATDSGHVMYGGKRIEFSILRRQRKTLEIAVEPDATVVVTAPTDAPMEAIAAMVRKRAAWVRRQQRFFSQFMPRTPERRYVAGETHLYLGRQYRLKVVHGRGPGVTMIRGFIIVETPEPDRPELTRRLLEGWYRRQARAKFVERLETSLARFSVPEGFRPAGLIVRRMEKRWGSLSPSGRLVLNRRLIEAPVDTIDYVIVHELCHMAEPHHGPAFYRLLDGVMPDWLERKQRLEERMA